MNVFVWDWDCNEGLIQLRNHNRNICNYRIVIFAMDKCRIEIYEYKLIREMVKPFLMLLLIKKVIEF